MNTQTLTIPGKFANLGVSQGFDPGPCVRRRFGLMGLPGNGKTTFLHSIPGCIILDFEDSGRSLPNPKASRFGPVPHENFYPKWEDYLPLIDQLKVRLLDRVRRPR